MGFYKFPRVTLHRRQYVYVSFRPCEAQVNVPVILACGHWVLQQIKFPLIFAGCLCFANEGQVPNINISLKIFNNALK